MTTLADIQKQAEKLSQARDALTGHLRALQVEVDAAKAAALPDIRAIARRISKQHTELQQAIRANPALFVKPRTYVIDGLKFGMQKKVGTLQWEDDQKLCERIHHLVAEKALTSEQERMLIATTEKPVAKTIEALEGKLLKRLGITLGQDVDEPLIKSVDGEIEKAVNAVIKDVTKDKNAEVPA